jgi:AraC-like DNA-binding protein
MDKLPDVEMIGQSVCPADWKLHERTIPGYELIFQHHGMVKFQIEDCTYILTPGDMLLIPPNVRHSGEAYDNTPCRFYFMLFYVKSEVQCIEDSNFVDHVTGLKEIAARETVKYCFILPDTYMDKIYLPTYFSIKGYRDEIFSIFEKALAERNKLTLNSRIMISLQLSQIMVLLTRLLIERYKIDIFISSEGEMPRLIIEAATYIHEHYSDKLTVKSISTLYGISSQYLIRLFKKKLGITPLQYINQVRILHAKELIRNSFMNFKEITYEIGLENPEYFSRLFKKVEGVPPSTLKRGLNSRSYY